MDNDTMCQLLKDVCASSLGLPKGYPGDAGSIRRRVELNVTGLQRHECKKKVIKLVAVHDTLTEKRARQCADILLSW
jgi:hypothetical protein